MTPTPSRGLLLLAVPVAGVVLLLGALTLRRPAQVKAGSAPKAVASAAMPSEAVPKELPAVRPLSAPASSASPVVHSSRPATPEEASLQATYDNFRIAVANGNENLQKALRPILLRNHAAAVRLAEREMADGSFPGRADLARQTLEALRR